MTKYKLKYVGGPVLDKVRYLHVKDSNNDRYFYNESISTVESTIFECNNTNSIVIESVPLFTVVILENSATIQEVTGHLSTHRDNWVDWSSRFSFGQYYSDAKVFNIKLGGQFYVKDGEFYTLNGLFKGMKHITQYDKFLFKDYIGGTVDGTNPIVGLIETFADNTSLSSIDPGMMQYLPRVESIRMTWMNTSISAIHPSTFTSNNSIRDTYKAFANTKIPKLDSNIIAINNN